MKSLLQLHAKPGFYRWLLRTVVCQQYRLLRGIRPDLEIKKDWSYPVLLRLNKRVHNLKSVVTTLSEVIHVLPDLNFRVAQSQVGCPKSQQAL